MKSDKCFIKPVEECVVYKPLNETEQNDECDEITEIKKIKPAKEVITISDDEDTSKTTNITTADEGTSKTTNITTADEDTSKTTDITTTNELVTEKRDDLAHDYDDDEMLGLHDFHVVDFEFDDAVAAGINTSQFVSGNLDLVDKNFVQSDGELLLDEIPSKPVINEAIDFPLKTKDDENRDTSACFDDKMAFSKGDCSLLTFEEHVADCLDKKSLSIEAKGLDNDKDVQTLNSDGSSDCPKENIDTQKMEDDISSITENKELTLTSSSKTTVVSKMKIDENNNNEGSATTKKEEACLEKMEHIETEINRGTVEAASNSYNEESLHNRLPQDNLSKEATVGGIIIQEKDSLNTDAKDRETDVSSSMQNNLQEYATETESDDKMYCTKRIEENHTATFYTELSHEKILPLSIIATENYDDEINSSNKPEKEIDNMQYISKLSNTISQTENLLKTGDSLPEGDPNITQRSVVSCLSEQSAVKSDATSILDTTSMSDLDLAPNMSAHSASELFNISSDDNLLLEMKNIKRCDDNSKDGKYDINEDDLEIEISVSEHERMHIDAKANSSVKSNMYEKLSDDDDDDLKGFELKDVYEVLSDNETTDNPIIDTVPMNLNLDPSAESDATTKIKGSNKKIEDPLMFNSNRPEPTFSLEEKGDHVTTYNVLTKRPEGTIASTSSITFGSNIKTDLKSSESDSIVSKQPQLSFNPIQGEIQPTISPAQKTDSPPKLIEMQPAEEAKGKILCKAVANSSKIDRKNYEVSLLTPISLITNSVTTPNEQSISSHRTSIGSESGTPNLSTHDEKYKPKEIAIHDVKQQSLHAEAAPAITESCDQLSSQRPVNQIPSSLSNRVTRSSKPSSNSTNKAMLAPVQSVSTKQTFSGKPFQHKATTIASSASGKHFQTADTINKQTLSHPRKTESQKPMPKKITKVFKRKVITGPEGVLPQQRVTKIIKSGIRRPPNMTGERLVEEAPYGSNKMNQLSSVNTERNINRPLNVAERLGPKPNRVEMSGDDFRATKSRRLVSHNEPVLSVPIREYGQQPQGSRTVVSLHQSDRMVYPQPSERLVRPSSHHEDRRVMEIKEPLISTPPKMTVTLGNSNQSPNVTGTKPSYIHGSFNCLFF